MTLDPQNAEFTDKVGFAAMSASNSGGEEYSDGGGPWTVHGVAIGDGDVTNGKTREGEEDPSYWPGEVLEESADDLVGRYIVDDRDHDDLDSLEPPARAIAGEITDAAYVEDVGLVYEGEVDDPEIAQQADRGRIDVSPAVFRQRGEYDEEIGARPVEAVAHWRDIAAVANGAAPSNEIATGTAEALSAEALEATFDGGDDGPAAPTTPAGQDANGDANASANGNTNMDLTETEENLIREARTYNDPAIVPAGAESLAEEAVEYDEPALVEGAELEALEADVEEIEDMFAEALAEQKDLRRETAEALSLDAMIGEFENEEGEFEPEALMAQEPEGNGGEDVDSDLDDEEEDEPELDTEDAEEIESMLNRADTMESVAPDHADSLRAEAMERADADSVEEIEMEVL
ncbi:hypothetical protein [Natronococcus roseus]|uniref:hypothetical protein n=1 Tax=Natronococcus roseus TaxID=1052014 RepID=UPI00374CAF0A